MDYSEMKASKESRSDKVKNALNDLLTSDDENKKQTKSSSSKKSTSSTTAKRGRGRPKGSKNKTSKSTSVGAIASGIVKEIAKSTATKSEKTGTKKSTASNSKSSQAKSSSGEQTKYDEMKATKVSKTEDLNFDRKTVNSTTTRIVKSSGNAKKTKNSRRKRDLSLIFVAIFFVIGVLGGFFGCKFLTRNDVYEMVKYENGETDVVIEKDGEVTDYVERGVKCIAFGKDYSKDYTVKYYYRDDLTNDEKLVESVDENTPGIYYAVYEVPTAKYKIVKLIRNIIVLREEDNG